MCGGRQLCEISNSYVQRFQSWYFPDKPYCSPIECSTEGFPLTVGVLYSWLGDLIVILNGPFVTNLQCVKRKYKLFVVFTVCGIEMNAIQDAYL